MSKALRRYRRSTKNLDCDTLLNELWSDAFSRDVEMRMHLSIEALVVSIIKLHDRIEKAKECGDAALFRSLKDMFHMCQIMLLMKTPLNHFQFESKAEVLMIVRLENGSQAFWNTVDAVLAEDAMHLNITDTAIFSRYPRRSASA